MNLTLVQKQEKVKDLRPIDDVFFEVLARDKDVCTEILRTILEDSGLLVEDVVVQSSQRNLYGRSVRLDALCALGNGTKCNIEVQRADNDDHLKRARLNASVITARESVSGEKFEKIIELYIIYISEADFLGGNKTTYHIDKVLRETGQVVDDGLHEIFVNAAIDDKTDISELMSCFMKKEVDNPKFPRLTAEVKRLKTSEGGTSAMCEVMQRYEKIAADKATKKARLMDLVQMINNGGSDDDLRRFLNATDEEISEAKKLRDSAILLR